MKFSALVLFRLLKISPFNCQILSSLQWRIQDFPEVGVPTPRGVPTYDFAKFSAKELHEIERISTGGGRGERVQKFCYVDAPLALKNVNAVMVIFV